ncbi:hypothetical protein Tco_1474043 [Tanacetum coccineum]
MAEGEIDNLTMEKYLALTRGNHSPGVVKPKIGGNVNFEIKSQFMRELKEDTFSGNKNDDAHEHVERVLDIVSLFNIPGVSHDAVMLRVFPITLTRTFLKKPLSKGTVHHPKPLSSLKNFVTLSRKVPKHYTKPGNGPIPGMTPAQALTAIQTMADHSQEWHDGSSSMNIYSISNYEGIVAIVSKLDNCGRDMKKLKENVHAIQVGCQLYRGAHLDKECPLNEEVKSIKEVNYGEFGRPFPNNNRNDGRFNRGVSGYDQPSSGERRPSLNETINKYMEEAAKRHAEQDEWLKKFYQSTKTNREAHDKIIQGLETKVRTLTNEVEGRTNGGTFKECNTIFTEDGSPLYTPFYYSLEEIEYFSANSGFTDNERQETDKSGMEKGLATLDITREIKEVP